MRWQYGFRAVSCERDEEVAEVADEEDRPRRKATHEIGSSLDTLSLHEFDERIALLEAEIARLRAAQQAKRAAQDAAGSVFKTR